MDTDASADLATIYAPIAREMEELDLFLRSEFEAREPFIHEILQHIACFRGKQIRPALLFLCAKLVGGEVTGEAIRIGGVLELIHTATLVHDDLLDGALLRRRVATVHERWGERPAILIGDFIYSRAFELSTQVAGMAALLSRTTHTICEGELLQIGSRCAPDISEDLYFEIIRKKTAILHSVACELGGVFAGLKPSLSRALGTIGMRLGMAFQVVDDCLDYAGDEEVVGKSLGTDLRQGKLTLPLLYLRNEMGPEEAEWLRMVLRGPIGAEDERRIHSLVKSNGVLAQSFGRAEAFVDEAMAAMASLSEAGLPLSPAVRESLELAAHYVLYRRR